MPPAIEYDAQLKQPLRLKGGSALVLMVSVKGDPRPETRWYLADDEITPEPGVTIEGDGSFSRLTIRDMGAQKAGNYKVVAENEAGSASANFDVIVQGRGTRPAPPPCVTGVYV